MLGNVRQEWAEYVDRTLKKHGLSTLSQRIRTGISHTTISSWLSGVQPGYNSAKAFAERLDENVVEALEAAGFDPIVRIEKLTGQLHQMSTEINEAMVAAAPTPAERLGPSMIALAKELGYEGPVTLRSWGGRDALTHAEVDQILADLRVDLETEMEERKKR